MLEANNSPTAIIAPPSPNNPTSSTSNNASVDNNEGGNTQTNGLELRDYHGPPLPIGIIEAQLDEAEANGKAFTRPSGKLEQIKDDEGPHHASATLAASLEATNKSPARCHVEIINDNAAPINPFDSTAGEFTKLSGKLEQIEDGEGSSDNSFAVLAASLEVTDKGADKRHVETMNDDAAPTPFSSTEFDDIQTGMIKAKTQTMDNHGHGEEPTSIGSSRDVIEGEDDIETGINPRAGEGGVGTTPPVTPTHRGDNNDDVVNEDDEGANMNGAATSNSIMEALITNRESQSDGIHVTEAYAVEGSDQEVAVATHLEPTPPALPWWKQRRFKFFRSAVFVVLAAMAIALGTSTTSLVVVERTNAPTISQAPTITFQPSSSVPPFPDLDTLKAAVRRYVSEEDCANVPTCAIWGWPMNSWRVELVTSFRYLFGDKRTFNEDINGWTTCQVTDMFGMFSQASAFNQPLNSWNTSQVTDIGYMFWQASAFNQPLKNWNTAKVTTMYRTFNAASAFNQPLNTWNTAQVNTMGQMFSETSAFNQPLNNWNTAQVTTMEAMFWEASAFNQPLNSWNTSNISLMRSMFQASAFNQNLCHFGDYYDPSKDYTSMFEGTSCPSTADPSSASGPWCQTC